MIAPPPVPPEEWRGRFLEERPEDEEEPDCGGGTPPWEDPLPGCGWRGAEEEVGGRSCNRR